MEQAGFEHAGVMDGESAEMMNWVCVE